MIPMILGFMQGAGGRFGYPPERLPAAISYCALSNVDKYGIATDRAEPEVNTWYVDQLVTDFKAARTRCTCNRGPHMPYCDLYC